MHMNISMIWTSHLGLPKLITTNLVIELLVCVLLYLYAVCQYIENNQSKQ